MAKIRYKNLGGDLRISDIVFAGSHDASIKEGSSYAKTQYKDIYGQADAGVRLFDLRILAKGSSDGGVSLVGYHGSAKKKGVGNFRSAHTGKSYKVNYAKKISGEFGLKLSSMLQDARRFVVRTNEFLIFKFDKCTNWQLIAEYCTNILEGDIFKTSPNQEFSKLTLNDLAGKVVCVFNEKNKQEEIIGLDETDGILGFRNLNGKPPHKYMANYPGLQYYGKGGTRWYAFWKTNAGKMDENKKKQRKLLAKLASQKEQDYTNVLGMMYWTSTGSVSSIKKRNEKMWKDAGVSKMKRMWTDCLESSIEAQIDSDDAKYMPYAQGARIKSFFPNIVMIDFADESKCNEIYNLNTLANDKLGEAFKDYGED